MNRGYCSVIILTQGCPSVNRTLSPDFSTFKEAKNRFQGITYASLSGGQVRQPYSYSVPSPRRMCKNFCTAKYRQLCVNSEHRPTFGACCLFVKKSPSFFLSIQTGKGNMDFKLKLQVQVSNKPRSSLSNTFLKVLPSS